MEGNDKMCFTCVHWGQGTDSGYTVVGGCTAPRPCWASQSRVGMNFSNGGDCQVWSKSTNEEIAKRIALVRRDNPTWGTDAAPDGPWREGRPLWIAESLLTPPPR